MKLFSGILFTALLITSCVPAKKYNELLDKEKQCQDELNKYKPMALENEAQNAELKAQIAQIEDQVSKLRKERSDLDLEHKTLRAKYDQLASINEALENNYDKLRLSGAKETAVLQGELQAKKKELQKKEDALLKLEQELLAKEHLLAEREMRLQYLEKIIKEKEDAVSLLKERVKANLLGFENKGLTIEERNGKIYVSMEAKLLFASGSIEVQPEGKRALVNLSQVLESEKELEIIVEGHTDTDKMAGTTHPKNNWELSVLRSTSVIDIMLKNSKITPSQLMAAGRSEFIPVDENDKAKNRRIEIIIAPKLDELYQLISE